MFKNFSIWWTFHSLCFDNLIIKNLLNLINWSTSNNKSSSISPFFQLYFNVLPIIVHFFDNFFDTKLLFSVLWNFFKFWQVIKDSFNLSQLFNVDLHFWMNSSCKLTDTFPMSLFHTRVRENSNKWSILNVIFDLIW